MQDIRAQLTTLTAAQIVQELTNAELQHFIDSYTRRDELATLPPAKAYEEDAQVGARVIYDYIDKLLARYIHILTQTHTLSAHDLDFMQHIYSYLAALDEEYGLYKGWFGSALGPEAAESQLKAEEYLNEILMAAYAIIRSSSLGGGKEILQRLENALEAYKKVGGVPNEYIATIIIPQLIEKAK
jgi:hypothetical protein